MNTNHPYYPLNSGTSIIYQIFSITGAWDNPSFSLGVLSRTYTRSRKISNSLTTAPLFFGELPLFVGYQHDMNVPDLPVNFSASLIDAVGFIGEDYFIGEVINQMGNVHIPPICKIPFAPTQGLTIEATSKVYLNKTTKTPIMNFKWKSKVVSYYQQWGVFTDVWRVGLREYNSLVNPAVLDTVYNYAFMRNVGLVDFWYGQFQPNGTIKGYEFYAIQY